MDDHDDVVILKSKTIDYQLFLGGVYGYTEQRFTIEDVQAAIWEFLEKRTLASSYNIVKCRYLRSGWSEDGYRIQTVNYPTRIQTPHELECGILALARFLMRHFRQERVSLVMGDETWLLQRKSRDADRIPGGAGKDSDRASDSPATS